MWSVDKNCNMVYKIIIQIKLYVDSSLNALTKIDVFTFLAYGSYLSDGKNSSQCMYRAFLASVSNTLTRLLKIVAFCEYL